MKKKKPVKFYKWAGYSLLALYLFSAAGFVWYCAALHMLPNGYLILAGILLAALGLLFAVMHKRPALSVLASVLTAVLTAGCILGAHYVSRTADMLSEISSSGTQKIMISTYVLRDDPAETAGDIAGYRIGILSGGHGESADKTVETLEQTTETDLDTVEFENAFQALDALKEQTVQAVVLNQAYVEIAAETEAYRWVLSDIRKLMETAYETTPKEELQASGDVPETFVMYISGIDTYGDISARSRSDVNILAAVNTKTKNVLLLSTPRDFYVEFQETGGAKDKLTHAGIYGVEASVDALERLYDVSVDYYLRVNFTGFVDIIDALGGIEVYSEYDFTVEPVKTYHQGYNQLTGLEALAFARERYSFSEGDFQRAKNQTEVIRGVLRKCASASFLKNYTSVMQAVSGSFETNMPKEQIAALVKMQLLDMAQWEVSTYTTQGTGMYAQTYSMPGQELYVIEPDEASVGEAKELLNRLYAENGKRTE